MSLEEDAAPDCLFIDYGQAAAAAEASASARIAEHYEVPHRMIECRGLQFGSGEIPGRNAFLLHLALMAFRGNAGVVTLAIHAGTPYRDCGPEFVSAMRASYDFHTGGRIGISVPFIANHKPEVLALTSDLKVPVALTHSCETSDSPCLECLSCRDREMLVAGT